ncbi:MAG TPA: head completion/stabilization protein [Sphingomonas sp.]|jgi:hypothetical protein|uniref:head completion/stabilization protein n=1 Tax=Sphingomonas sp. TaxID=28214 RepID=UPI002EDA033C
MSGFVYSGGSDDCGTSVIPPAVPMIDAPIVNDGWLPDIDLARLRREIRVRESVTPERLRSAAVGAVLTVSNDLVEWQAARQAEGHATLAAIPAPRLDGQSRNTILYIRAVACFAKAELVERYRDIDTTAAGDRKADALDQTPDDLRRDGRHAIRDLLGRDRTTVDLI